MFDANNYNLYLNIGHSNFYLFDYYKAEENYELSLKICPTNYESNISLGLVYMK